MRHDPNTPPLPEAGKPVLVKLQTPLGYLKIPIILAQRCPSRHKAQDDWCVVAPNDTDEFETSDIECWWDMPTEGQLDLLGEHDAATKSD